MNLMLHIIFFYKILACSKFASEIIGVCIFFLLKKAIQIMFWKICSIYYLVMFKVDLLELGSCRYAKER